MKKSVTKLIAALLLSAWFPFASAQIIFSAPPREKPEVGKQIYGPIAKYLSTAIGQQVVYKHPGNWTNYKNALQHDKYDIVFDGPHFVSWRMSYKRHRPLVTLPGQLSFVVVVRANQKQYKTLANLAGKRICGFNAPNLATLTMFNQFRPQDRPHLVKIRSFPDGYQKMRAGKCDAVVMRDRMYYKLDKDDGRTRIVFLSGALPNQAFTAGKRLSRRTQRKIASALVNPRAKWATAAFHQKYTRGKSMIKVEPTNFEDLDELLYTVKGFGG
ncbi:MAG: PhnD/SsuA/transferrin family substrate-binding protein [Acidiferrobacterales bacterium]